jgi:hypothetical protein
VERRDIHHYFFEEGMAVCDCFQLYLSLVSTAGTLILVSGTIATHNLNLMVAFIGFLLVFR